MTKLDEEIHQVRQRVQAATQARGRAEGQRMAAVEAYHQALAKLFEEFGVEDLDQAQDLLAQLERQAASELEKVKQQLAAAEDPA